MCSMMDVPTKTRGTGKTAQHMIQCSCVCLKVCPSDCALTKSEAQTRVYIFRDTDTHTERYVYADNKRLGKAISHTVNCARADKEIVRETYANDVIWKIDECCERETQIAKETDIMKKCGGILVVIDFFD